MKTTSLLAVVLGIAALLPACTTVKTDPRSPRYTRSQTSTSSGGGGTTRRVNIEQPQPAPIRLKPGSQPPQYLNTTGSSSGQTGQSGSSPYDGSNSGPTSPLRHDIPDQPPYSR